MIFLNPQHVQFDGSPVDQVAAIVINRRAERLAIEYSDKGPHPVFVDAPEQRITVVITRDLIEGDPMIEGAIAPGHAAELSFATSPNASEAQSRSFAFTVVVTAVEHDLKRGKGARETITCIAISSNGASDPMALHGGGK